jgi:hypothetical protein
VSFANRNEKAHLPYGQGTLRAEPLAEALAAFERPATVIGESPDEASNEAIRAVLFGERDRHRSRRRLIGSSTHDFPDASEHQARRGSVRERAL